jgi:hypothetical protein
MSFRWPWSKTAQERRDAFIERKAADLYRAGLSPSIAVYVAHDLAAEVFDDASDDELTPVMVRDPIVEDDRRAPCSAVVDRMAAWIDQAGAEERRALIGQLIDELRLESFEDFQRWLRTKPPEESRQWSRS